MTAMRSSNTGRVILCVLDDCERAGNTEHEIRVQEPSGRILHYLFCSETHMWMYANGHIDYGKLPSGRKSRTRFH